MSAAEHSSTIRWPAASAVPESFAGSSGLEEWGQAPHAHPCFSVLSSWFKSASSGTLGSDARRETRPGRCHPATSRSSSRRQTPRRFARRISDTATWDSPCSGSHSNKKFIRAWARQSGQSRRKTQTRPRSTGPTADDRDRGADALVDVVAAEQRRSPKWRPNSTAAGAPAAGSGIPASPFFGKCADEAGEHQQGTRKAAFLRGAMREAVPARPFRHRRR